MKNTTKITYAAFAAIPFLLLPLISEAAGFTKNLLPGMKNGEVKILQTCLARDKAVYPAGIASGYYGKLTEQAVKKFQKKYGISQTGVVGPKTIAKLNEIFPGSFEQTSTGMVFVENVDPSLPLISDVTATPTKNSVSLTWKTNVPTTARLWFGAPSPLNLGLNPVTSSELITSRSASFSNLATSTDYFFVIAATDAAGKTATSTEFTFKTLAK